MRKIITYILAVSMLAFVMIPDVSYAADVEKKSAVTEDKISGNEQRFYNA